MLEEPLGGQMTCARGKAAPNQLTKLRLFAASAGYCQNPACLRPLFVETGSDVIHVAEMAHVFAANDDGPRANEQLSEAERGAFENLVLLCPTCHTTIDKAEANFPASLLTSWKREHQARLAQVFGAVRLASRSEVRAAIEPLLQENRVIFEEYNPELPYRENPEAEQADVWRRKMRERIIPNSRRIMSILDVNREHMIEDESRVFELFRQHIHDLEVRHLTDIDPAEQRRFPVEMSRMMARS